MSLKGGGVADNPFIHALSLYDLECGFRHPTHLMPRRKRDYLG